MREPVGVAYELDRLLAALGRVYMVANAELRVVEFSARLPEILGRSAQQLVGAPLEEVLGEEVTGSDGVVREVLRSGRRREGLRVFLHRSGGERMAVSLTVGALGNGDPHGFGAVTFRDGAAQAGDLAAGAGGPAAVGSGGPVAAGAGAGAGRADGDGEGLRGGGAARSAAVVLMIRSEQEEEAPVPSYGGIVARSAVMQRIFRLIELLRDHDSTVLVTGESGTGKELVARALHDTSSRHDEPFVAVNCAALPSELLESELFGHVRGAFTGAVRDRIGRFELADGGTLFLDEVGSMSLPLQAKILRALQEHAFERVGDTRTRHVDVRILAATNENLGRAVQEHRFREDLYYRLRVVPIEIPPLRERREDIEAITRFLLHRIGTTRGRSLRLAPSAMDAIRGYPWPGNVRELDNALEFATTVCEGQTIHVEHLPVEVRAAGVETGAPGEYRPWATHGQLPGTGSTPAAELPSSPWRASTADGGRAAHAADHRIPPHLSAAEAAEARQILDALARARFSRQDAARLLGISRTTLWRKMKEYRL